MRSSGRWRRTNEVAMPNSSGNRSAKNEPDPLPGGHEVQYVLIGSLIGAILLLIVLAIVTTH
jgi:hypothetical protein